MNPKINFDSQVFPEETRDLDVSVFKEIVDTFSHVKPIFISRGEFNGKKSDFFIKKQEDSNIHHYDLFLPHDLKIYELPAIIKRINTATFSEWEWEDITLKEMPLYESSRELQIKIAIVMKKLLVILQDKEIPKEQREEIQRALRNYYKLYNQIAPKNELAINSEWKWAIKDLEWKINNLKWIISTWETEEYKKFQDRINEIQTRENLAELNDEVSGEFLTHFKESLFEMWVNNIRSWMMMMTSSEERVLNKWFNNWEIILSRVEGEKLEDEEKLLRDSIWIDGKNGFKKRLENARRSKDKKEIEKIEIEAVNKIIFELYKYPYQVTKEENWYKPKRILETKELQCVWFSLLWHTFLSELKIDHKWLSLESHSALEVNIWGVLYYFDPTNSKKIYQIEYWETHWEYYELKFKKEDRLELDGIWLKKKLIALSWDAEKTLYLHILNNKWIQLSESWNHMKAINIFEDAIKSNTNYYSLYLNKWVALAKIWEINKDNELFKKAIEAFDKAISINPYFDSAYINKAGFILKTWNKDDALVIINNALKINPLNDRSNFLKWIILLKTIEYGKATKAFKKAMEINIFNPIYYEYIWESLMKTWKKKSWYLYKYTARMINMIKWNQWFVDMDTHYVKEKWEIKRMLKEGWNLINLKTYLLKIENEEK